MNKELICRTIINILDVKHCNEWQIFAGDDLYDVLYKYLAKLVHGNDEAFSDIDKLMARNELIIKKLAENKPTSIEDERKFMENLRTFKRKWILKKNI